MRVSQNPLEETRNAIKELKSRIQGNITDEDSTKRKYTDQRQLAQKIRKWSVESVLESIADQESRHAESFRKMIKELDEEEKRITAQIETERRKKDEDQRKLADQQKREMEAQRDRLNKARIDNIRRKGSGYG